jgi:hypothetical protein
LLTETYSKALKGAKKAELTSELESTDAECHHRTRKNRKANPPKVDSGDSSESDSSVGDAVSPSTALSPPSAPFYSGSGKVSLRIYKRRLFEYLPSEISKRFFLV